MSLRWTTTPSRAFGDLATAYVTAIRRGARAIADRYAPEIEAYMKENALWTDRTSNARQTLSTEVQQLSMDLLEILMTDGMEYFIYLELAHGGRFAIIGPTIDIYGPRIMDDIRRMMR